MRSVSRRSLAFVIMALVLQSASWSSAQVMVVEPGSTVPQPAAPEPRASEPRVMLVSPAEEPRPALKYRFGVAPSEQRPGNAMVVVQRAMLLFHEARTADSDREYVERSAEWNQGDLDDLPREEIRRYLTRFRNVLDELRDLPYLEGAKYDLRFQHMTGVQLIRLMLPELQQARNLARLVQLDIRLALAEGRHEDVIRSLRVGFRLGDVVHSTTPTIIGKLVGVAISSVMLELTGEAMTIPAAPNYYWALASLPDGQWEMREAVEFETSAMVRGMSTLATLPEESLDPDAWRMRLLGTMREFYQLVEIPDPGQRSDPAIQLAAGFFTLALDGQARRYLESIGEDVTRMSPSEAVLRATRHDLVRVRDEQIKWALLPHWVGRIPIPDVSVELNVLDYHEDAPSRFPTRAMVWLFEPANEAARNAGLRGRQTVAVLATAEALRMHAARHGQFPETLEQLDSVPAWPDPFTDATFQFEYRSPGEVVLKRTSSIRSWSPPDLVLRLREKPTE